MFPDFYISGDMLSVYAGDRVENRLSGVSVGERHICGGSKTVNGLFAIFFQFAKIWRFSGTFERHRTAS